MRAHGFTELLTTHEAAQILRKHFITLHKWRAAGTGPPWVKIGRGVYYRADDLTAFIEQARSEPNGAQQ